VTSSFADEGLKILNQRRLFVILRTQETEQLISFLWLETDRTGNTSFQDSMFTTAVELIKDLHTTGVVRLQNTAKGRGEQ